MKLLRRLFGKPAYRGQGPLPRVAGDYYKFYSGLHLQLWQSAGVAL